MRLPRSLWLRSLLAWTAVVWLLIVLLLPGASVTRAPCNPLGADHPDPALPTCGLDDFNAAGVLIALLVLLWVAGIAIGLAAFAVAWLARSLRGGR